LKNLCKSFSEKRLTFREHFSTPAGALKDGVAECGDPSRDKGGAWTRMVADD
jgi:hypothetical protein